MNTMIKAVTFTGAKQAELLDSPFDDSPPKPDEVVGRTLATLISPGTEINCMYVGGDSGTPTYPIVPGYAAVFEVEAVGSDVKDVRVGDRCFCMGRHIARQRAPRSGIVPLPARLAPEVAVFIRLMAVSWTTLVTTTARPPDPVLVTGLGIVGNLAAQLFHTAGYRVTGADPVESRRALARQAGIPDARASVPTDAATFALAVECSGHEQAALDACHAVRKRGEVVLVGCPWRKRTELTAHSFLHAVFHRYVVLRSGWEWELPHAAREFTTGSIFGNLAGALQWLHEGRVDVRRLFRRASPAEAQAVYQSLLGAPADYLTAVFDWTVSRSMFAAS